MIYTSDYLKAALLDWHSKDAAKNSASHEIRDGNLLCLWKTKTFLLIKHNSYPAI